MYFKPIPTCISFELLHQLFIPLAFSKKEGNSLSISKLDIKSIATPTTSATTKNCVRDLLDFFQWDPATAETQRHMNIEDSIAKKGAKKGPPLDLTIALLLRKRRRLETSKKTSTYRIGVYIIIFLNSNTLPFILYFISTHFSLSMIKGFARPSPV